MRTPSHVPIENADWEISRGSGGRFCREPAERDEPNPRDQAALLSRWRFECPLGCRPERHACQKASRTELLQMQNCQIAHPLCFLAPVLLPCYLLFPYLTLFQSAGDGLARIYLAI